MGRGQRVLQQFTLVDEFPVLRTLVNVIWNSLRIVGAQLSVYNHAQRPFRLGRLAQPI